MSNLLLLITAWVALVSPSIPSEWEYNFEITRAVNQIGVHLELVDPQSDRHRGYPCLSTLRSDFQEMITLALPRTVDARRFPGPQWVEGERAFWKEYARGCYDLMSWQGKSESDEEWFWFWEEMRTRKKIWDLIRLAVDPDVGVLQRRRSLHQIKGLIGVDNYYNGTYPAIVPLQHFRMIR